MRAESRAVSSEMISSASRWRAASGMRPSWSVSTNIRIEVSGVRRSCETLFTKSVWSFASRASRKMTASTAADPPMVVVTSATMSRRRRSPAATEP